MINPTWHIAADTLTLNDGDLVSVWPDLTNSGKDAVASGDESPTFKTNILNNLPVVRFNGLSNLMTFSSAVSAQPCTIFIVVKAQAKNERNPFLTSADSPGGALDVYLSSNNLELFAGTYLLGGGDITGKFNVISAVFNGASSKFFINGELASTGDAGNEFPTSSQIIGKEWTGQYLDGDMAEIQIFNSELSDVDRATVENSLGTKWNVVINPPYAAHFVYLIPSDKTNVGEQAIHNTALHIQSWLQWQMGNGKTITLTDPIVEVHQTSHPAAFYASDEGQGVIILTPGAFFESGKRYKIVEYNVGDDFVNAGAPSNASGVEFIGRGISATNWTHGSVVADMFLSWSANVLNDAVTLAGAGFGQSHATWVIYCDAPVADGQIAGGNGGPSGVAYLHAKDVASIMGIDHDWTQCRGIGGHCHELLHTFGRPHPVGDPNWNIAVMGIGYMVYPNAILVQADKDALNTSKFFTVQPTLNPPVGLCPFNVSSGYSGYSGYSSYSGYSGSGYSAPSGYSSYCGFSGYSGLSSYSGFNGIPSIPHALNATNIKETSAQLNWQPSSGATGYRLDVSLDSTFNHNVYPNIDIGNVTNYVVNGLHKKMFYYYRVRAYNSNSNSFSSFSSTIKFKTN